MSVMGELTTAEWNKMRCESALKMLALLFFADFFTTYLLIEYGGWQEGNPIMNYVIQAAGTTWALLWAKLAIFGYVIGFYTLNDEFHRKMQHPRMIWLLRGLVLFYAAVVCFSIYHVMQIPIS